MPTDKSPTTITPSSGCVFFDLNVDCEMPGCTVCQTIWLTSAIIIDEIGGILDRSDETDSYGGTDQIVRKLAARIVKELPDAE